LATSLGPYVREGERAGSLLPTHHEPPVDSAGHHCSTSLHGDLRGHQRILRLGLLVESSCGVEISTWTTRFDSMSQRLEHLDARHVLTRTKAVDTTFDDFVPCVLIERLRVD
jgi:hypothetical protein